MSTSYRYRLLTLSFLLATGALLHAQPTITSVSACPQGPDGPQLFGITAGSPASSFELCIFGTFSPTGAPAITWKNLTSGAQTASLELFNFGNGFLVANVPSGLYASTVQPDQSDLIQINVSEGSSTSAPGNFVVIPKLQTGGPIFPVPLGSPFSEPLFSFGTGPYNIVLANGATLPPGMPPFPTSGQFWFGTPSQAGVYNFSFTVTDAWGNSLTTSESMYVVPVPSLTSLSTNKVTAGSAGFTLTISGSGFVAPVVVQNTPEPGSVVTLVPSSNPSGAITLAITNSTANQLMVQVPTSALVGTGIYGILVTNPGPQTSNALPFTVNPGITGLNPAVRTATTASFPLTITGTGFSSGSVAFFGGTALTTVFSGGNLTATVPASLIQTPGSFPISVINPDATTVTGANFTVLTPPSITALTPPSAVAGAGNTPLSVIGTNFAAGIAVFWNQTPLTPVTLNGTTQANVTIPAALLQSPGFASITVVTNDGYTSVGQNFTILPPLQVTTASLPGGIVGTPYSFVLSASGGVPPYTWTATNVPPGITFTTSGVGAGTFGGSPTTAGSFTVGLTVKDSLNNTGSAQLGLTVTPPLVLTTTSLPGAFVGTFYSFTLTATGGAQPYTWSVQNLPPGFSFDTVAGTLSGIPTTAGTSTLSFGVQDAIQGSASARLPITVGPPPTVPTITSLSQSSVVAGSPTFSLTIFGAAFVAPVAGQISNSIPGSIVSLTPVGNPNATQTLTVTSYAPNQLIATVPAGLIGSTGLYTIMVTNPGAVVSNAVSFKVVPGLTSINPSTRTATTGAFNITLTGAGYVSGARAFAGTLGLTTVLGSATSLTATVPASTIQTAGAVPITVVNPDTTTSAAINLTALAPPVIVSLSPPSVAVGAGNTALIVNGTNFTSGTSVFFNQTQLAPVVLTGTTQLGVTIPAALLQTVGSATITVRTSDGFVSPGQLLGIGAPLSLLTTSLPAAFVGTFYSFPLTATGGAPPYIFTATNLPQGLSVSNNGTISGTPTTAGSVTVTVSVRDATNSTVNAQLPISVSAPSQQIQITTFPTLTPGVVGTAYTSTLVATGGLAPYTFKVTSGTLPAGLSLAANGTISGTPTALGTSKFTVQATDGNGLTDSRDFSLVIGPSKITITTGPLSSAPTGAALSIQFAATGGAPPYTFTEFGQLPPGLQFSSTGALTGTPTTVGSFTFIVFANDTANGSGSQSYTLTITLPGLIITTTSPLPAGKTGTPYSAPFEATGGQPPFTWTAIGLPQGLTMSNTTGLITGIPSQDGTFDVAVTVSDSNPNKIAVTTAHFSLTIAATKLVITTASLPNGNVGIAYTPSVVAAGGDQPYTFTATGLPAGVTLSSTGSFSGTPTAGGSFTIAVTVKDAASATATASFPVTIASQLIITTTSIANGVVGSPLTAKLAASGGTPPYTFVASGLPAGLTLALDGTLSGTPAAQGTTSFSVTVTDNGGGAATKTLQLTVGLPAAPPVTVTGLTDTVAPASQPRLQIVLGSAYPVNVTAKLTLTFTPKTGADDPSVVFSSGGRTAQIVVPAGSTGGLTDVGIQTGTVAGTITVAVQLLAGAQDVTPTPAPTRTIQVPAAAPVITSAAAARGSSSFTVTVVGFASSRELTTATFTFTGTAGATLQTTQATVNVTSLFSTWFQSTAAAPFGSQFTYTQPFTVTGNSSDIQSVTVTLTNAVGSSSTVTANLQ